jgi:hypothetical protein
MDISERYDITDFEIDNTRVQTHKRDIGEHSYSFIRVVVEGASAPSIRVSRIVYEPVHRL